MRFIEEEKEDTEVRKQAVPFVPVQNRCVFQVFQFKKVLSKF